MPQTYPEASLDAPETTAARRAVIARKRLLRAFYDGAYAWFVEQSRDLPQGVRLELGSGAGYLKQVMPQVVTSDVLELPFVDQVVFAERLPFPDASLAAIYMVDTLHHVPDVGAFLAEAQRTLRPGGRILLHEPANTAFGRFIYRNFHHEPFEPAAREWSFPSTGPLSSANGALPWIVFERDRVLFEQRYPGLRIGAIDYCHPLLYLLSGGFTMRQLLPDAATPFVLGFETLLGPLNPWLGMFTRIVVERRQES